MFLFYLFLSILNIIVSKNEKLIFVETIFRHGARAPIKVNNSRDLMGVNWNYTGELTAIGKRMEYLLGVYNRERYIQNFKFLSEKYDPHEILIYSSDINRTLISISSLLQALYPMSNETGDKLNKEQLTTAVPPLNISCEEIDDKINTLKDSALPNYMNIFPIHFITIENTTDQCVAKIKEISNQNSQNKKIILDFVEEFNKNFSKQLNQAYERPKENKFNFSFIFPIYDAMICDITEGKDKDISDFCKMNNIDMDTYIAKRYEAEAIQYRDSYFGDDKNEVILFYITPVFKQMIYNMKRKIDDDIKGNPSLKNVSDFSVPKMVIISGHDTTLSSNELFFIKYFGLKMEQYEYPRYASQINYEIRRDEDITGKSLNYSDYKLSYYFNNKLLLNISFDKFVEKVESVIWSNERMDQFCFGEKKKETKVFKEDEIEASLIIIIIMGFIILILVIVIIFLVIKLTYRKDDLFESFKDNKLLNDGK